MPTYTDQLGRAINISQLPQRIISLVPSQTELLYDLGLEESVVGITKFCVHPEQWFRTKERIGGTKNINVEKIRSLHPHLIIANKEENVKEQIDALSADFPVWVSDVNDLAGAFEMIQAIGQVTGREERAGNIVDGIQENFSRFKNPGPHRRTAYLIWKDPYMSVGGDTFIHHLLAEAGFENVFCDRTRYPQVCIDEIRASGCDVLLLSSEPYPFKETHVAHLQEQLPGTAVMLVDGELFSWYGSRLLKAPAYFKSLRDQLSLIL